MAGKPGPGFPVGVQGVGVLGSIRAQTCPVNRHQGGFVPVSVDREECYGSAECVYRVPDVFRVVDGYGEVIPGQEGADEDPRVIAAAEACPSQAIRISQAS